MRRSDLRLHERWKRCDGCNWYDRCDGCNRCYGCYGGDWCERCNWCGGNGPETLQETKRGEAIFVRLCRRHRPIDDAALQQLVQCRTHLFQTRGIGFRRVGNERLHLIANAAYEAIRRVRERKQGLAVEPQLRREQLRVYRLVGHKAAGLVENRPQRPSAQSRRHRSSHEIEECRQHIDVLYRLRHTSAGTRLAGLLDDQWDSQRRIVERDAIARIAVVRGENDRRIVIALRLFQLLDQTADDQVGGGCIDLQKQEVALVRLRLDPTVGRIERRGAGTLRQRALIDRLVRDFGVVIRKPLSEARRSTQQERRHRGTGVEAAIAQQPGDGSRLVLQRISAFVANAVVEWK